MGAVEALYVYRKRAQQVHEACNVVMSFVSEADQWAAEADDYLLRTGQVLGPLHGVPCSVKDHITMEGYPVTMGWDHLKAKNTPASMNSAIILALREAGAIIFARTVMSENGDTWSGGSTAFGDTLNPWNTLMTPGGSSSGEGALVGAAGSAFGIGSDIGGSVRIPATFCGLTTLKPTAKRLTLNMDDGKTILRVPGDHDVLMSPGPMARRVEDLVQVFDALLTPTLFQRDVGVPPMPLNRNALNSTHTLRIGWYLEDYVSPMACPAAQRAIRMVKEALEAVGHVLVPFNPSSQPGLTENDWETLNLALILNQVQGVQAPAPKVAQHPHRVNAAKLFHERLQHFPVPPKYDKIVGRDRFRDKFAKYWRSLQLDALLCPAFPISAPPVELCSLLPVFCDATRIFNVLDYPAGVVPVTLVEPNDLQLGYDLGHPEFNEEITNAFHKTLEGSLGLPVAVQLVSFPWQEELLLRLMLEVQNLVPFGRKHHFELVPIPRRCLELGGSPEVVRSKF